MELKGKSSLFAFICVLLYIAGSLTYSGQSSSIHGSFIIVAKVNDGIMMASDSRCSFPYINSKGIRSELAYIDNFQKIYIVGKNAIAVSGNFSIDNLFVSTMLEEFKKTNNDDKLNIKGLLPAFFQF